VGCAFVAGLNVTANPQAMLVFLVLAMGLGFVATKR